MLFLSSRNFGDKWFLTDDGQVVDFRFSIKCDTKHLLYGSPIKKTRKLFYISNFIKENLCIFEQPREIRAEILRIKSSNGKNGMHPKKRKQYFHATFTYIKMNNKIKQNIF